MSLEDTSTIDIISKPKNGKGLELILCDGGEITDEIRRYNLIVEKLVSYVEFVATGQHLHKSPEVRTDEITIRILCASAPNEAMKNIVSVVSRQHPDVRLPVVIETDTDFRLRMGLAPAKQKRKWWQLW